MSHLRPTRRQLLLHHPVNDSRSSNDTNRSIYALIDEYEDDWEPPPPQANTLRLQGQNTKDVPVVHVHDLSDGEDAHDTKKKQKTDEGEGSGSKVKQTYLQCGVCFEPTTDGSDHHLHVIRCGHIFGRECIEPWIAAKMPSTCPICNHVSEDGLLIWLYVTSSRDDMLEEALAKAETVNELIAKHRAEKKIPDWAESEAVSNYPRLCGNIVNGGLRPHEVLVLAESQPFARNVLHNSSNSSGIGSRNQIFPKS